MAAATAKMPLQAINGAAGSDASAQYKKLSQRDHILVRPDSYIGSIETQTETLLVHTGAAFVLKKISFVPGLFKIFDEILVNAADNKQRDKSMDTIKVEIDVDTNTISVYNTGKGIPVQIHSKEKIYIPEMIFGHLLTGANFNDDEKKVVGGRNGYGAKLTNIFSTRFVVETCDTERGLRYKQVFENNMSVTGEATITPAAKDEQDFTKVTFSPDLRRFNMSTLTPDVVALLTRRVYDVAGSTHGVKVYFNGKRVPIKGFKDYIELVTTDLNIETPMVYEKVNERWEIAMTLSKDNFQQVSFVNSIATYKGGTHVNHVADQIVAALDKIVAKKNKGLPIKPAQIKQHMWLFVNCLVENPSFDSQTKENMTRKAKDFGSTAELSDKFLKEVTKSGIVDIILDFAKHKSDMAILKSHKGSKKGKLKGHPKLDDANDAGGRNAHLCTLILTEGDSAKALAVSGLGVVGRDHYGVFPLRGKLLNVREANHKQLVENEEIKAITQIMGLQHGTEYTDVKQLRYGQLMIMTDQDQDGSHIKGLLINFIHHFWPSLLKLDDFLVEFITPIVKATKGKLEKSFFTLPQYKNWVEQQGSSKGWRVKYYKGLGTSTPQEAKEYFSNMDHHQKNFKYTDQADFDAIEMAFSKKKVDARKEWLANFQPGTFLDHSQDYITYNDFVNKELILFSIANLQRSIPSIMDGLKPGQRKVLFACFKRNLTLEIKVAQLGGYVAEHSAYHHGEQSLADTIVGMAQDYVGSNNINLLMPIGQFGTRLAGGKDAASTRYIFTTLSPLARKLFVASDDDLLKYLDDDGQTIEPEWYCPILPMVLVNGSDGIGTGWSSYVPNFNPREIVQNLLRMLSNEPTQPMRPWYKGFDGEIVQLKSDKYIVKGKLTKTSDTTVEIKELPIGTWTQSYKEALEKMTVGEDEKPALIAEYSQHHTDTAVHFVVTLTPEQMAAAEEKGLEKFFKVESSLSTTNMTLFDASGRIKRYESAEAILREFFEPRLRLYQHRKTLLADQLQEQYERLDNKVRFIKAIISGSLVINNRKRDSILRDLVAQGFKPFPKKSGRHDPKEEAETAAALGEDGMELEAAPAAAAAATTSDYDYLLSMSLWALTLEKVTKLEQERAETEAELSTLLGKTPEQLWQEDLQEFMAALDAHEDTERSAKGAVLTKGGKGRKAGAAKAKAKVSRKKAEKDSDDDFVDDEEAEDADWGQAKSKAGKAKAEKKAGPVAVVAAATVVASAAAKKKTEKEKEKLVGAAGVTSAAAAAAAAAASIAASISFAAKPAAPATVSAPAAKPKPAKAKAAPVVVADDDDDDEEEEEKESAFEFAAAPPVARAHRQAAKAINYASMDQSFEKEGEDGSVGAGDEEEENVAPKATAIAKAFEFKSASYSQDVVGTQSSKTAGAASAAAAAKPKPKPAKKLKRAAESDEEEDAFEPDEEDFGGEDDEDEDFDEDFGAKAKKSKASKSSKPKKVAEKPAEKPPAMVAEKKKASKPKAAKSSRAGREEDDDFEDAPSPKTKKVAKKAAVEADEELEAVKAKAPKEAKPAKPPKKATAAAAASKPKKAPKEDDDEDGGMADTAVTPAVKNRSRRAVSRVNYNFDAEEDVSAFEEDEDEDFEAKAMEEDDE